MGLFRKKKLFLPALIMMLVCAFLYTPVAAQEVAANAPPSRAFSRGGQQEFIVEAPSNGYYNLSLSLQPNSDELTFIDISVEVNGTFQFAESESIRLYVNWIENGDILLDRFGYEVPPQQAIEKKAYDIMFSDSDGNDPYPFEFYLEKGVNSIIIENLRTDFYIGDLTVHEVQKAPSYEQYAASHSGNVVDYIKEYEAEKTRWRNNPSIYPEIVLDPSVTPFESGRLRLNVIGSETFFSAGEEISWEIEAPEDGFYYITFKTRQMTAEMANMPVFRTIKIDGEIPFAELESYIFDYNSRWGNFTLGNESGAFKFYLTKGTHELSMRVDNSRLIGVQNQIERYIDEINELSLQVRKMTGNVTDRNREWDLTEFMPDIQEILDEWVSGTKEIYEYLSEISTGNESKAAVFAKLAYQSLINIAKDPNDLPNQLSALSTNPTSVMIMLSNTLDFTSYQALAVDKIFIHGETSLPNPEASFWVKILENIKRFLRTFVRTDLISSENSHEEVSVWVNRNRMFVNLLQQMTDTEFTAETGIKVTFSLMPDESKIVLANASGTNPDATLGTSTNYPYELAVRDALVDLTEMDGFFSVMSEFQPGAFISYAINDSIYALPETQDFWVMAYRTDILEQLNLSIPDTWNDVVGMLPTLQRFGMNFAPNISTFAAIKPFAATLPYIRQFGGHLVSSDGRRTAIDTEESLQGIKFMTDLYTIYSAPEQVTSFFQSFNNGEIPIGVTNFGSYIQLSFAAKQLAGKWAIAPMPGVLNDDGVVARYAPGSATCAMIMKNSDKNEAAWEFMKWYMSGEVQERYARNLYVTFGDGFIWNSANIEAFKHNIMPEADKEIILEQWEWLEELPRIPGYYMIERELSNVWNSVVFDGKNVRDAVDDAAITINREIERKMEELKFTVDGELVRPFSVPTVEKIESWVEYE